MKNLKKKKNLDLPTHSLNIRVGNCKQTIFEGWLYKGVELIAVRD